MKFKDTPSDRANFSDCILKLLTLPGCLLKRLRSERGRIRRDLGIRAVLVHTLCARVLGRLAHVPCAKKQGKAVRRLQIMLVGGVTKKRKAFKRPGASKETRDRALAYVERCVSEYLASDFESAFGEGIGKNFEYTKFYKYICTGDELLEDILRTLEESPSLRHILPVSVVSVVCIFLEFMIFGRIVTLEGVDSDAVQQLRHYDVYGVLESISLTCLKAVHPCSGIVAGGDDRPLFPPCSVRGRDGEIAKIGISHTALAGALCMAARMRKPSWSTGRLERGNEEKLGLDTLIPFLLDVMVKKGEEERAYESMMHAGEELLCKEQGTVMVMLKHLNPFFETYEALQKCVGVSVSTFRGRGVLFRSRHMPDVVRCRQEEKQKGVSDVVLAVQEEMESDLRNFRRGKDSCLDSAVGVMKKDGKQGLRYNCPYAKDLCHFFIRCFRLAEKIIDRTRNMEAGEDSASDIVCGLRQRVFQDLIFGLFGCNLSGNITELYEEYIFSSIMRHFDEDEGTVRTLKAASNRRDTVRIGKPRKLRRGTGGKTDKADDVGREGDFAITDDEWGPPVPV